MPEKRAKYSSDELDELGKKGHAFKNDDGSYSYPIADVEELKKTIRAVGRGGADHDAIRKYIIKRAKALKESDLIPDNWNADGSLKETNSLRQTPEERETANDMFSALDGAVDDAYDDEGPYFWTWVQDWYGDGSDDYPYTVVYVAGGDLYAAPFSFDENNKIELGEPVKVRQVTTYVERTNVSHLAEWRKQKAEELGGLERREFEVTDLELRDADDTTWNLTGYASVTETPYEVGFYTETVKRGAFKRTLNENPDVQLLINHEGLPLARTRSGTLRLEERDRGLWVDADLDKRDPDAQRLERKMSRRDIDQMSFAFQVTAQEWNDDYTEREIKGVSIHRGDVSVVNQAANVASVASIRSAQALESLRRCGPEAIVEAFREWRDYTLIPLDERADRPISSRAMEVLSQFANLGAVADESADEAKPLLADFMSTPSPASAEQDQQPEDDESGDRSAALPDHTTRARQQLALIERARR